MRKLGVLAFAVVMLAVAVPMASASSGSTVMHAYNTVVVENAKVVKKPAATAPKSHPTHVSGTLPFTGMNLGFVVAAGVLIAGVGLVLFRLGRTTQ
jgi:hypothetical protein